MSWTWRMRRPWVLLAAMAASAFLPSAATAQEVVLFQVLQDDFEVDASVFDSWMFGGVGAGNQHQRVLDAQVEIYVEAIDQACGLGDAQRLKLQLAAKGDCKHFLDQVEVLRAKFMAVRKDQQAVNDLYQEIAPLRMKFASGLFGPESLLQKVIVNTLDDEQYEKWLEDQSRRGRYRFEAMIDQFVLTLSQSLALTEEQRTAFREKLLQTAGDHSIPGTYAQYYLQYQLGRIPERELRELVDEKQWEALQAHVQQANALAPFLRQQGILK